MKTERSKDGTVKLNFPAGYSAVIIPLGDKKTLCLSSQVGCSVGLFLEKRHPGEKLI